MKTLVVEEDLLARAILASVRHTSPPWTEASLDIILTT
ncbi:MAG: hypothetical protein ACI8ZB_002300 [Desulforhopalus sp.]|jgi:hypothetical protein